MGPKLDCKGPKLDCKGPVFLKESLGLINYEFKFIIGICCPKNKGNNKYS